MKQHTNGKQAICVLFNSIKQLQNDGIECAKEKSLTFDVAEIKLLY